MYAVFGDPSLKIPMARDTVTVHGDKRVASPGDQIGVSVTFPFVPTRVVVTMFDTTETSTPRIQNATTDIVPTGAQVNFTRTVPGGYAQPYIGVRVYGYDNAGHSATGALRVGTADKNYVTIRPVSPLRVAQPAVFDVEVAGPDVPDSITVWLKYSNPVVTSGAMTYKVSQTGPGQYRSDPVDGQLLPPGTTIVVDVPLFNIPDRSGLDTFYVEGGADPAAFAPTPLDTSRTSGRSRANLGDLNGGQIAIPNQTIGMNYTASGPRLTATVYNWGDQPADDIAYNFYHSDPLDGNERIIASGTVSIPAYGQARVEAPVGDQWPVDRVVKLNVKSTDRWKDGYPWNNWTTAVASLSAGAYTPALGFTKDGVTSSQYEILHLGYLAMKPGTATQPGAVIVSRVENFPESNQPFTYVRFGDSVLSVRAIRLTSTQSVSDDAPLDTLNLIIDPRDSSAFDSRRMSIVRYNTTTRLWTAYPTIRYESPRRLTAVVPPDGIFAIVISEDVQGPEIKFSVEGQFYSSGTAVPRDARFSIVIYDPSGVSTDLNTMMVTLDGKQLQAGTDFVLIDSTVTATTTSIRIQTDLDPGSHQLCVQATDRLGNRSPVICTDFDVENDLRVIVYGNFPNPFGRQMFIAYEIRGATVVDEVEVKIFTASGRLVKTMRFPSEYPAEVVGLMQGGTGQPTSLSYHEAWWDGRDDGGGEVANGVYFYRLRVKYRDDVVEHTGVIARLR
jgi:hypothetical protein